MSVMYYNPHLFVNGGRYNLPIPIVSGEFNHKWKGKRHSIPLGVDCWTGRVKGPIGITLSGIVCVDHDYVRLSELDMWELIFELEDWLNGGRYKDYMLVLNDGYPYVKYMECYTEEFTYTKIEGPTTHIPWTVKIDCVQPLVEL